MSTQIHFIVHFDSPCKIVGFCRDMTFFALDKTWELQDAKTVLINGRSFTTPLPTVAYPYDISFHTMITTAGAIERLGFSLLPTYPSGPMPQKENNWVQIIVGKRCSGKTTFVADLLRQHCQSGAKVILGGTTATCEKWKEFEHPFNIELASCELFKNMIHDQMNLEFKEGSEHLHIWIVLDDCFSSVELKHVVAEFASKVRQYKTHLIVTADKLSTLPSQLQENADHIFEHLSGTHHFQETGSDGP